MGAAASYDHSQVIRPGEILAGKYRIESQAGAGAMGIVARAVHLELNTTVAIKFLRPNLMNERDSVERFLREAKTVALLQSEHVARVFDAGRDPRGVPFMVMEFLEGKDLNQVLLDDGVMSVELAVRYVRQACEGLVAAHAVGLVHRDVKPHNMFLAARSGGKPIVKLVDFGISKILDDFAQPGLKSQETLTSSAMLGTPYYMAPEHMLSAKKADPRSDLWSLGVCLHRFLTGSFPFEADSVVALAARVMREPPSDPRSFRSDVPADLAAIVFKALAKDAKDRFQSAVEFADALDVFSMSTSLRGARPVSHLASNPPQFTFGPDPNRRLDGRTLRDANPSDASTAPTIPRSRAILLALTGMMGVLSAIAIVILLTTANANGRSKPASASSASVTSASVAQVALSVASSASPVASAPASATPIPSASVAPPPPPPTTRRIPISHTPSEEFPGHR